MTLFALPCSHTKRIVWPWTPCVDADWARTETLGSTAKQLKAKKDAATRFVYMAKVLSLSLESMDHRGFLLAQLIQRGLEASCELLD
jgi:hypothetical protein